jgi:hypothetical protein
MKNAFLNKSCLYLLCAAGLLACSDNKNNPQDKYKVVGKKNNKIYVDNSGDSIPEKVIYFDGIDNKGNLGKRARTGYIIIYDYIKMGDILSLDKYNYDRKAIRIPAYQITNTPVSFHPVIYYVNDTGYLEFINQRKNEKLRNKMLDEWQKQ